MKLTGLFNTLVQAIQSVGDCLLTRPIAKPQQPAQWRYTLNASIQDAETSSKSRLSCKCRCEKHNHTGPSTEPDLFEPTHFTVPVPASNKHVAAFPTAICLTVPVAPWLRTSYLPVLSCPAVETPAARFPPCETAQACPFKGTSTDC